MAQKEYLKMADVFPGGAPGFPAYWNDEKVKHAAHAISSHDELVSRCELLEVAARQAADMLDDYSGLLAHNGYYEVAGLKDLISTLKKAAGVE